MTLSLCHKSSILIKATDVLPFVWPYIWTKSLYHLLNLTPETTKPWGVWMIFKLWWLTTNQDKNQQSIPNTTQNHSHVWRSLINWIGCWSSRARRQHIVEQLINYIRKYNRRDVLYPEQILSESLSIRAQGMPSPEACKRCPQRIRGITTHQHRWCIIDINTPLTWSRQGTVTKLLWQPLPAALPLQLLYIKHNEVHNTSTTFYAKQLNAIVKHDLKKYYTNTFNVL